MRRERGESRFPRTGRTVRAMIVFLAAAFLMVFTGCGASKAFWYQTGKESSVLRKDLFDCQEEAAQYSKNMGKAGKQEIVEERIKKCMEVRGYVLIKEEELPSGAPRIGQ